MRRIRCWWFGCEMDPYDTAPIGITRCVRCAEVVTYSDAVGDTRHYRTKAWLTFWLFRKWLPEKCAACGGRWRHDETKDHLPF